jgi:mono/diheme cytochrome c family protein
VKQRIVATFLLASVVLLAGCSLAGDVTPPPSLATAQAAQQRQTTPRPGPEASPTASTTSLSLPASPPNPAAGSDIYEEDCAACHGPTGNGDGEMASGLEFEPSALADPQLARVASPSDWYQVVTQGRMNRFMPPFRSLSDKQRWDVVAHALSLSISEDEIERGRALFTQHCQSCHTDEGEQADEIADFPQSGGWASSSVEDLYTLVSEGRGEMPSFQGEIPTEDRWALAAYVQSLGFASEEATVEQRQALDAGALEEGVIRGRIVNGTEGASVPQDLKVQIVGFDGQTPVVEQEAFVDEFGAFDFSGVEIQSGRIFAAFVEYQDVLYFSDSGHFMEGEPVLELPITVFEVSQSSQPVLVRRLHILFDFRIEGFVDVTEVWVVSNQGDETLVGDSGQGAIQVMLPEGSSNLQFFDAPAERFVPVEGGFLDQEPLIPGEAQELVFGFILPYERDLDFRQPIDYSVDGAIILTAQGAPQVRGERLEDRGVQDMGGVMMHSYALGSAVAGDTLTLQISGRHPLQASTLPSTSLLLGAGALAAALVVVGLWFFRVRDVSTAVSKPPGEAPKATKDSLLRKIAALDDAYDAGSIEESVYRERRADLKRDLIDLMEVEGD